ncbi:hypothetical protein [Pseudomonas chlororaphis]|jgi:hypothetical protein|uniref:hypothetical protein n=1 Tax=Pseudomonas chlororaphis TaxID=587753 RepID=UPI002407B9A4|nr:hypothetical protein [Pseudomonas chlororaphis]
MSLSSQDIASIAALDAPVLCVDTCTLLDVIRDITRDSVVLSDVSAGLTLLATAELDSELTVLVAEQVTIELLTHIEGVEQEAQRGLERFQTQASRIHCVADTYGAQGILNAQYLNGHVDRGKRPAKSHSNAVSRAERVACITGCTLTLYHTLHA